jgi:hypothetical protein
MSDFRVTIQVSDMERRSLAAIVSAGNKMSARADAPPDDVDTDLAFGLADDVLQSVSRMRKSIARDKSIQDAQGLLRHALRDGRFDLEGLKSLAWSIDYNLRQMVCTREQLQLRIDEMAAQMREREARHAE